MKLLVFAHTPPPHHGQSFMVQQMLEGFGGDQRKKANKARTADPPYAIQCYHVNARVSKHMEDIGTFRYGKILLMIGYCAQAIWCRFRYRIPNLYYVPAPGKGAALYRDWLVMALCRPFFKRVILHWHASGLAKWLETVPQVRTRSITFRLVGQPDLSIVLADCGRPDAKKLWSRAIKVVGNGIPDPCPDFETEVLPRRLARFKARMKLLDGEALTPAEIHASGGDPHIFRIVFLAHCTREKGLFDTVEAVALANKQLNQSGSPLRLELVVAGAFMTPSEKTEFEHRIAQPDLRIAGLSLDRETGELRASREETPTVQYRGFLSGAEKNRAFAESDCFSFPTYYYAESFGLVVVEAMAFGLAVVATRWRSIPELLPEGYSGLVKPRSPAEVASALLEMARRDLAVEFRQHFLDQFLIEKSLARLAGVLHDAEQQPPFISRLPIPPE